MVEGAEELKVRVEVRLFAAYREAVGSSRLQLSLDQGTRVADLLARLCADYPRLAATQGLIAVNREYVGPEYALHDGDEVALIPPVSGGAACSR